MAANGDNNDMEDAGDADDSEADDEQLAAMEAAIRVIKHGITGRFCARRGSKWVCYARSKQGVLREVWRQFGAGWRAQGFQAPKPDDN
jgi:hypothetical protein